jgi:hypothetical protein
MVEPTATPEATAARTSCALCEDSGAVIAVQSKSFGLMVLVCFFLFFFAMGGRAARPEFASENFSGEGLLGGLWHSKNLWGSRA